MLHLVGVTRGFTPKEAHQRRLSGEVCRITHGVYCDEKDLENMPEFMRKNALRIANYLFPKAVLTHASAFQKGPVAAENATVHNPQWEIFLASTYTRSVKLPYVDVVITNTLKDKELHPYSVAMADHQEERYGVLRIRCSGDELLMLQAFGRQRYNLNKFLDDEQLQELTNRLTLKHGHRLIPVLQTVAAGLGGHKAELRRAMEHLDAAPELYDIASLTNVLDEFDVVWHRRPVAKLLQTGTGWHLKYRQDWVLPLAIKPSTSEQMPVFVQNLFPEGHLMSVVEGAIREMTEAIDKENKGSVKRPSVLSVSERFLSNVSIVQRLDRLSELPVDALHGRLSEHADADGVFRGRVDDLPQIHPRHPQALDDALALKSMPRLPGHQTKLPCFLDRDGRLMAANGLPFTHFLKLPGFGRDHQHARGAMEWLGLTLAKSAGLDTNAFALVDLPNGTLGCLVERFDVPESEKDFRLIMSEDFCSVAGLSPQSKMIIENGIESVIDVYRRVCDDNAHDAEQLLRMIHVNALLENGDFHLKNLGILRVAEPTLHAFRSTRLAPTFDVMPTRYFSDFAVDPQRRETMILDYKGQGVIDASVIRKLGPALGFSDADTQRILQDTATRLANAAQKLADALPPVFEFHPHLKAIALDALARAAHFCHQDCPSAAPLSHPDVRHVNGVPCVELPTGRAPMAPAPALAGATPFNTDMLLESLEGFAKPELLAKLRAKL